MPDHLANKIAAGEVVERPASVVKELVENSIDAGSTWINIELIEAGLQSIRISDNGYGMEQGDAKRAFHRHATSKILDENDLFHVRTLGFRGEALASIAAVSRLTLQTSTGAEAGARMKFEGGKIIEEAKSDARQGTEILVEELFYNTPARLKYMKTIHTELGHITDVLNRMALAHPDIKFTCTHNEKELFRTNGRGDLLQVIAQVYGMKVARQMVPIETETLDFKITGYIAKPEVYRASRNYISTIINDRFIRNIALNKAIQQGYHTLLPIGKSPIVILKIEMDPILVDVNVHPAKLEVRFSKEKELYDIVESTIRESFRKETLIPQVKQKDNKKSVKPYSDQTSFNFSETSRSEEGLSSSPAVPSVSTPESNPFKEAQHSVVREMQTEQDVLREPEKTETTPSVDIESSKNQNRVPTMYPIGQLHGTYILAQNEEGMYIVDQHAAQERIKYEFFRDRIGEVAQEVQELLVPMTFEFQKHEALRIEEYKEELEGVGLFFEPFGESSYIIRSHPQWFPKGFEEEVIHEMVEQLMSGERIHVGKLREEAAILMSCKRSIKANHYLNQTDMFQLLEDLRTSTDPFTCPHGRPIIVFFSEYEMEKMFKRVM
ncbi:DNA mismatch repair endonuclease MutL [Halobacillus naozhouensis]|uniref:DNA mismatch repair protein MutL n=1 Tax=Halobacillus naozhouensis TaxID=554880 RepID=A0ABY8J7V9_9BACI|nr:DNA mismatch repair endonuclease MutL [Halobacillus naozhouensis]WFT76956.1 DNA mismatch repair endonuclease MutL [Halobacillus naozhouensis]